MVLASTTADALDLLGFEAVSVAAVYGLGFQVEVVDFFHLEDFTPIFFLGYGHCVTLHNITTHINYIGVVHGYCTVIHSGR